MNNPKDARRKNAFDSVRFSNAINVDIERKKKTRMCSNLS